MKEILQDILKKKELSEDNFNKLWVFLESIGGDIFAETEFEKIRIRLENSGVDILI